VIAQIERAGRLTPEQLANVHITGPNGTVMPLSAVATSQVLQIVAATSGSLETIRHGFVHWQTAALITVFELAGVILGVRLAHVASAAFLRRLAGALCVVTGALLLVRSV